MQTNLSLRRSKEQVPIGRLIMDQAVMAGIGNIYRSEILWRQALHPETPGNRIDQQTFNRIWEDARILLTIGVKQCNYYCYGARLPTPLS